MDRNTCWVLTGPTASGKTALSIRLAQEQFGDAAEELLSHFTRPATKRRRPVSPLPRSMAWSISPMRISREAGSSMKITDAQKVSNRALM